MNNAQWIKEAEENAKRYSDELKKNNQYLIDQLNASKTNTLEQLQKQQNNAIYNVNSNQSAINSSAEDAARQANINRMLALKDNASAMSRAGLSTQGIVGSQVNDINSSYGNNINDILKNKQSQLNELAKQRNDINTQYDTNRINLENEYGNNLANLQSQISDKALNQYNTIYNSYLAMKQQEYENEQAEKARLEAIRQYNEQMAYQKARDAIADAQYQQQLASSYSGSYGGGYGFTDDTFTEEETTPTIDDTSISPLLRKIRTAAALVGNGINNIGNKNTYSIPNTSNSIPDNIGGTKLKNTGKTGIVNGKSMPICIYSDPNTNTSYRVIFDVRQNKWVKYNG